MIIEKILEQKRIRDRETRARRKYENDKNKYISLVQEIGGIPITGENIWLYDYEENAGDVDGQYFLQDIHVAELVISSGAKKHYDIGSKMDSFIAHLLAYRGIDEVVMLDIRPFPYEVNKLSFIQTDATLLDNIEDSSIESISSLHAIEHFGLGRYGDTVDPMACYKAMKSIQRVAAINGKIYVSTPVSMKDACYFNAHRVFCPNTIVEQFDKCLLEEVSFIHPGFKIETFSGTEANRIIEKREYELTAYDCGIFVFTKQCE